MLYVGVDWAEAEHAACLLDAAGAVVRRLTIPQRRAGLARLRAAIAAAEPEPAAVLVAIERTGRAAGRRPAGGRVRRLRTQPEGGRAVPRADPAVGRQDRPGRRGAARPDPGHGPRPAPAAAAEQPGGRGAARARPPGRGGQPRPDARCRTACARTCWRPSRPSWTRSPTWPHSRPCASSSAGRPRPRPARSPRRSSRRSSERRATPAPRRGRRPHPCGAARRRPGRPDPPGCGPRRRDPARRPAAAPAPRAARRLGEAPARAALRRPSPP